jgi:transcriptional regulator with XRE-family HTH domain
MDRPSYLRALRILSGYTQQEVATHLSKSQVYVSGLETGTHRIKNRDIAALALLFDISVPKLTASLKAPKSDEVTATVSLALALLFDATNNAPGESLILRLFKAVQRTQG